MYMSVISSGLNDLACLIATGHVDRRTVLQGLVAISRSHPGWSTVNTTRTDFVAACTHLENMIVAAEWVDDPDTNEPRRLARTIVHMIIMLCDERRLQATTIRWLHSPPPLNFVAQSNAQLSHAAANAA